MADARGGYRKPGNPAPVSGPGSLARRTDGGPGGQPVRLPSGGQYGDRQQLQQLQQSAPLADSPGGDAVAPQGAGMPDLPGFGEASAQPDVPVTAGADMGAGPGMDALQLTPQRDTDMERLIAWLPALERMANVPGASASARNLVRYIKSQA